MFLMGVVFFLVLLLTFAIVLTVTRPTSEERTIEGRIARLRGALSSSSEPEGRQLCHHQANALERNPLAGPIAAALEAGQSHPVAAGPGTKPVERLRRAGLESGAGSRRLCRRLLRVAEPGPGAAAGRGLCRPAFPVPALQAHAPSEGIQPPLAGVHRPDEPRFARRSHR